MASIRIPTPLRTYTKGKDEVSVKGRTVKDVLSGLDKDYPGIGPRILESDGRLRRFVNLYVNDQDIRGLRQLDTEVQEADVLSIVPAIAGGRE